MMTGALDTPKPPPIIVGVQGIDASVVNTQDERNEDALNIFDVMDHLVDLPPFQMFAAESLKSNTALSIPAIRRALREASRLELERMYDEYCQWHANKGYWPNENPMGRLIQ